MNNENVLAIETSTSECSVALQTADGQNASNNPFWQ